MVQAEQLLTERETARLLAVSPTTLATWRSRHRYALRFVRLGSARAIRYRLADVLSFVAAGLVEGDKPSDPKPEAKARERARLKVRRQDSAAEVGT